MSAVLVDPGDMRTRMHQDAFPGEDISDRPLPDVTAPFWNWLFDQEPGGRPRPAVRRTTRGCAMAATGVIGDFTLPARLEAAEPPEARGLRRDEVRLLVSRIDDGLDRARALPRSAALALRRRPARRQHQRHAERRAVGRRRRRRREFELHLSTRCPEASGRSKCGARATVASLPYREALRGHDLRLPEGGGGVTLLAPYPLVDSSTRESRLWIAALQLPATASCVSRPVRIPDSLRLRPGSLALVDVPDGVRHRAGQRGNAVGRRARSRRNW